jgi:hypothetical protein
MINFFRVLNPLGIILLAVLLFVLRAGYLLNAPYHLPFAFSTPLQTLLIPKFNEIVITPSLNIFIAGVLVFVQALLLNYLVNYYNLLGKPTFLPALMYITVSGLFPPFLVLTPPLVCNFFVIWMLHKLLSFYKGTDVKSTAYDLGMIVAAGSLIYLPFVCFFLSIWVALFLFRPFNWREIVAGVIGYITIFFFLAVYYYLNNCLNQFNTLWGPLAAKFPVSFNINYYNYLVLVPVIIILILCLFKLQQNFLKSYVQVRKSFQLLLVMLLLVIFAFYTEAAFNTEHFLLCAVPAAIFFAYYFLYAKVRWFYEITFCLLLIGIIYFQFNTF